MTNEQKNDGPPFLGLRPAAGGAPLSTAEENEIDERLAVLSEMLEDDCSEGTVWRFLREQKCLGRSETYCKVLHDGAMAMWAMSARGGRKECGS